jgi:membrane-associated phospholipid phosphatase
MFAAGGLALASSFIPPADASWSGNDFDDSVRDGMRLKSSEARKTVRGAGDVFFYGLMAYPVVVDSLIVALPRDSEVAWQMIVMNGESLALSALASVAMARTTGRERPYLRECRRGTPDTEWDCGSNPEEDAKSFPSGHALMAFTGAGLICTHHAYLPLYGGGIPDGIACGVALAGATFNGASRVMADRHYFTDVLVGSALGLTSGIALPIALHYGKDATGTTETAIVPYASGSQIGVMGQF